MAFWAMWSAPLEIAADLRNISETSAAILKNSEVIQVGQDPLVSQARRVWKKQGMQLWRKRLVDGGVAVLVYNGEETPSPSFYTVMLEEVGFANCDRVIVRDLINRKDLGVHVGQVTLMDPIPAHGVAMLNMTVVWP